MIGGVGLIVTLAALIGIPTVLVTHRDFMKVESGSAVPVPSTTAQVRLALAPVSGDGRGDLRMTGLGFGPNARVVVTANAAGSSATARVGDVTANDPGAFS